MKNYITHNCQNLETRRKDCGRLVNDYKMEDAMIRDLLNASPSYPNLDDHTLIAFDKNGKGYSAKDLVAEG